ncbi:MAG: Gfo/Idh/MocA family oxidoreductase, partial [Verrucomicrobiota bacterium]
AENSHTEAIAKDINELKLIDGFSVEMVWGETREFAEKAAEAGQIPNIVDDPVEMLGKIDALIVDHRHPKFHLEAALPFIKAGIPAFIDKPFCYRAEEGKRFLETARECGASVTSFSVIIHQKAFLDFKAEMGEAGKVLAGETWGVCDLDSPHGGVFFYGIHQVDMALKAFGYDVEKVLMTRNGNGATGQLMYPDGKIVTMHMIKEGFWGFGIGVVGTEKAIHRSIPMDEHMYLTGEKTFCKMFETGEEPETGEGMLVPVRVLEALEKSIESGQLENVLE